ncbi:UNVERIFIED_CONTAM: hypothetical protein Sangu_2423500 [Sesamum angustifolium]|uniref:Uncharacterized protein n=1 Tax=Sesamum angustifolium TaxID=2727405 RepID=A0AAW2L068_9LAMI
MGVVWVQAWAKVMKAAAKHFKKKKNKKKDSNLHVDDLSNYFTDGNSHMQSPSAISLNFLSAAAVD